MNITLDKIDLNILDNLQKNGRMTNVDLAKSAGISAPPCLRRVGMLEKEGVLQGYHADLSAQALGFGVIIFAEVTLSSQNDHDLRAFEEHVNKLPLVRECYMVTGGSDFLLKIVAKDFDAYQNFLSTELSKMSIVSNTNTKMVMRNSKKLPGIPLEEVKL